MKRSMTTSRTAVTTILKLIIFLLLLSPAVSHAADVTLTWDPNSEGDLAGYKLYYDGDSDDEMYQGTGANEGDSPIIIYLKDLADPDSPVFSVTGLEVGQYYYFALTAFNTEGLESDFSDEVGTLIQDPAVSDKAAATDSTSTESGSGGSGCFISGAMGNDPAELPMAMAAILLLVAAAIARCLPTATRDFCRKRI